MQIPNKIKTAGNPIDYLPYKIISIKLLSKNTIILNDYSIKEQNKS